jgi:hypothetical protein
VTTEEPDPKVPAFRVSEKGSGSGVLLGEERRLISLSVDNEDCLAWLADALQQLRQEGRTKVVGYLEAVLEEVVFEAKMTPK